MDEPFGPLRQRPAMRRSEIKNLLKNVRSSKARPNTHFSAWLESEGWSHPTEGTDQSLDELANHDADRECAKRVAPRFIPKDVTVVLSCHKAQLSRTDGAAQVDHYLYGHPRRPE